MNYKIITMMLLATHSSFTAAEDPTEPHRNRKRIYTDEHSDEINTQGDFLSQHPGASLFKGPDSNREQYLVCRELGDTKTEVYFNKNTFRKERVLTLQRQPNGFWLMIQEKNF